MDFYAAYPLRQRKSRAVPEDAAKRWRAVPVRVAFPAAAVRLYRFGGTNRRADNRSFPIAASRGVRAARVVSTAAAQSDGVHHTSDSWGLKSHRLSHFTLEVGVDHAAQVHHPIQRLYIHEIWRL